MGRFDGKVALVTGATRGIGQATAVRLARDGARVAVNYRASGDPAETLRRIEGVGGSGFAVEADMRDPKQVVDMVHEVARVGGRLDFLVSNAAINPLLRWSQITLEDFDAIQETNLRGTWVVCKAAAQQMIDEGHGGAIVCVSSISAVVGAKEQTVYCATKAGISMLVKSLAIDFAPRGIRINAVLPGTILTDMSGPLLEPGSESRKYYETRIPMGRIGDPDEIAGPIAYLLSEDASYVTSAELLVDGGFITNAE